MSPLQQPCACIIVSDPKVEAGNDDDGADDRSVGEYSNLSLPKIFIRGNQGMTNCPILCCFGTRIYSESSPWISTESTPILYIFKYQALKTPPKPL